MAFGRKNDEDSITREEATEALSGYVTKADAASVVADLAELKGRVGALETLAEQLKRSNPAGLVSRETRSAVREDEGVRRDPAGSVVRPQGSPLAGQSRIDQRFTLDYDAIAFGLSEIARKVRRAVGAKGFGGSQAMADYYRETVQYFADVFAKSDPEFDADAFKRQSGV